MYLIQHWSFTAHTLGVGSKNNMCYASLNLFFLIIIVYINMIRDSHLLLN